MDCVIAVGPTSHDDFELRYCLRSLNNLPIDQVYTVGRKPSWLHNTHHLLVPDPHPIKSCNIITKILCCCALDISDPFVFISDDQLIINKTKEIPYTHGADLTNQPDKMLSANNWYRCLLNSRNKLRKNNINTFVHHDTH